MTTPRETAIVTDGESDGEMVERKRSTTITIDETMHDSEPETSAILVTPTGTPKSILKRAHSMRSRRASDEQRDVLSPLRDSAQQTLPARSSQPRLQPFPPSRIPRLQVHWPETSSVCSEPATMYATLPRSTPRNSRKPPPSTMTTSYDSRLPPPRAARTPPRALDLLMDPTPPADPIMLSRENTPDGSVASSSASAIVGNWWWGRDTRSVPHCERRHLPADQVVQYLTPTQRHAKEMKTMEKKLQLADGSLEDKERHLAQLRARLNELEGIIDTNNSMMENHRLTNRMRDMQTIIDRLTTEKAHNVKEHEKRMKLHSVPKVSTASMTTCKSFVTTSTNTDSNEEGFVEQIATLQSTVDDKCNELTRLHSLVLQLRTEAELTTRMSTMNGITNAMLPGSTHDIADVKVQAQLEAHRQEAIAWRTRAAQLDMSMKELQNEMVAKGYCTLDSAVTIAGEARRRGSLATAIDSVVGSRRPSDPDLRSTVERSFASSIHAYFRVFHLQAYDIAEFLHLNDSGYSATAVDANGECVRQSCVHRRDDDGERIALLTERLTNANDKIDDTEAELHHAKTKLIHTAARLEQTDGSLESYRHKYEQSKTKFDAAGLTVSRLQEENVNLRATVEEQHEQSEQIRARMIDAGFYVGRKMLSIDPSYVTSTSKSAQTELTAEALMQNDFEFKNLNQRMEDIQLRHSTEHDQFADIMTEVQASLVGKVTLVKTLTDQLAAGNEVYDATVTAMNREREEFSRALAELTEVASRVPILELELDNAQELLRAAERQIVEEKEEFDDAIEVSIEKHMQNTAETIDYWQQKMAICDKHSDELKSRVAYLETELSATKMRMNLEKVTIFDELQHSYGEVSDLHTIVYKSKTDVGMMAMAETIETGTTVLPQFSHAFTQLVKGDLFDPIEERLNLTRGELATTERQVQVLQGKLQDRLVDLESARTETDELQSSHAATIDRLDEVADEHEQLTKRCAQLADHTRDMSAVDSNRFRQLEAEFDNVKLEMDAVIQRYEAEKRRLKDKGAQLTTTNDELRKELASMVETNRLGEMLTTMSMGSCGSSIAGDTADDMMLEFDMLEHRLETLTGETTPIGGVGTADQLTISDPTSATAAGKLSPRRKARKNAPAIKFLLERLQTEREKHVATNETLVKQVRELNGVVDMIGSTRAKKYAPISRAESLPVIPSLYEGAPRFVDSTTVATIRTKNLCLMRENERLKGEFGVIRQQVTDVLGKQNALQTIAERTNPSGDHHLQTGLVADTDGHSLYEEASDTAQITADGSQTPAAALKVQKVAKSTGLFASLAHTFSGLTSAAATTTTATGEATERSDSVLQMTSTEGQTVSGEICATSRTDDDGGSHYDDALSTGHQAPSTAVVRHQTGLVADLDEVRLDLQSILQSIDTATTTQVGESTMARENRLMMWLEDELRDEEAEMHAMNKWYDADKKRLDAELAVVKAERAVMAAENDTLAFDFHDVCRELELYKMEESQRLVQLGAAALIKYRSFDDLRGGRNERQDWKGKYGGMYRELLVIQRSFELRDRKCRELQIDNDMLAGEVIILRAEQELECENRSKLQNGSDHQTPPKEIAFEFAGYAPPIASPSATTDRAAKMRSLYDTHLTTIRSQLHEATTSEHALRDAKLAVERENRLLDTTIATLNVELKEANDDLDDMRRQLEEATTDTPTKNAVVDAAVQPDLVYVDVEANVRQLEEQLTSTVAQLGDLRRYEEERLKMNVAPPLTTAPAVPVSDMWTQAMVATYSRGTLTDDDGGGSQRRDSSDRSSTSPTTTMGNRPLIRVQASFSSASVEMEESRVLDKISEVSSRSETSPSPPTSTSMGVQTDDVFVSSLTPSDSMTRSAHSTLNRPPTLVVKSTVITLGTPAALKKLDASQVSSCAEAELEVSESEEEEDVDFNTINDKKASQSPTKSVTSIDGFHLPHGVRERSASAPNHSSLERELMALSDECSSMLPPSNDKSAIKSQSKSLSASPVFSDDLDGIYAQMEHECALMKTAIDRDEVMSRSLTVGTLPSDGDKWRRAKHDFERQRRTLEQHYEAKLKQEVARLTVAQHTRRPNELNSADNEDVVNELRQEIVQVVAEKNAAIHQLQTEVDRLERELSDVMCRNTLRDGAHATTSHGGDTSETDISLNLSADEPPWLHVPSKAGVASDSSTTADESVYLSADWSEDNVTTGGTSFVTAISSQSLATTTDDRSATPKADVEVERLRDELTTVTMEADGRVLRLTAERDDLEQRLVKAEAASAGVNDELTTTISELQRTIGQITSELDMQREQQQHDNLAMFNKGQEAARYELGSGHSSQSDIGHARDVSEPPISTSSRAQMSDDEVTLRFLRDATFYYLVTRGKDTQDHLNAIMTLLRFTQDQRIKVGKIKPKAH